MKKIIKKTSSSSNTKIKNINETIILAPSELDYKPKKCERCFYLEKNYKIAPKDFPPPVGKRPSTEWLSIAEEIISNWPLRN